MAECSRRTGINADCVIRELARVGFSVLTDFVDPQTAIIREEASADDVASLASVKIRRTKTENGETIEREIKLVDKSPTRQP